MRVGKPKNAEFTNCSILADMAGSLAMIFPTRSMEASGDCNSFMTSKYKEGRLGRLWILESNWRKASCESKSRMAVVCEPAPALKVSDG